MYRIIKIYLFLLFITVLLSACGEVSTQTVPPAASLSNTPLPLVKTTNSNPTTTQTISPATTPLTQPQNTPTCYFAADVAGLTLGGQIKQAQDIVQVQVTKISPSVWNTADGNAPTNICGSFEYGQYSPVEISITETYLGNLKTGNSLTVLLSGAPGSVRQGNYDYFPKVSDKLILFLGEEHNYRPTNPTNPLISRIVWPIYHQEQPNSQTWYSEIYQTKFTTPELKAIIKDPKAEPTPIPYPPTATPAVKAGQTLQPVTAYVLAKAKSAYQKGPQSRPELLGSIISGTGRFNSLIKAIDQPLLVEANLNEYPAAGAETIPFGFERADGSYVSFVYDPKANSLTHALPPDGNSIVLLQVPPGLKEALGLG